MTAVRLQLVAIILVLALLPARAQAVEAVFGSFGLSAHDSMTAAQLGARQVLLPQLVTTGFGICSLALEGHLGWWHGSEGDIGTLALVPMLRFRFDHALAGCSPYLEGGIGAAVMSDTDIEGRELGSHFTFSDNLGVGLLFGAEDQYRLGLRYTHLSNAGLAEDNQGIDIGRLLLEYAF